MMTKTLDLFILLLCVNLLWQTKPGTCSAIARPIDELDDVESQLSIYPSDEEETIGLDGNNLIYTDFCITTRDNVMGDIRHSASQLATRVFGLLFKSFERIGFNGGSLTELAPAPSPFLNQQLTPQDVDMEAQVYGSSAENSQMEEVTTPQPTPMRSRGIFGSVMKILSATKNVVTTNVKQSLYSLKSTMGINAVTSIIKDACNKVENYELDMRERFEETTSHLGGVALSDLENLNCVTTNRVLNLAYFCRMAMTAHEPISKVIAFTSGI